MLIPYYIKPFYLNEFQPDRFVDMNCSQILTDRNSKFLLPYFISDIDYYDEIKMDI